LFTAILVAFLVFDREGTDLVEFASGEFELAVEDVDAEAQALDLVSEGDDDAGEWILDLVGIGDEDALAVLVDDVGGDSDDGGVGRDVAEDDGTGSDAGIFSDDDVAEDLGVAADEDSFAEGGVTLAAFVAGASEGDSLIEGDVVTDDGSFPDDDARAVVDEDAAAEGGSWVDFDSCDETGELGEQAGDEAEFGSPQARGDALNPDGVEAGIAEDDHEPRTGRWVAGQDGVDVFADGGEHGENRV
jgi:hypothetical protein